MGNCGNHPAWANNTPFSYSRPRLNAAPVAALGALGKGSRPMRPILYGFPLCQSGRKPREHAG